MLTEEQLSKIINDLGMQKLAAFNTERGLGYALIAALVAKLFGANNWIAGAAGAAGALGGGTLLLPGVDFLKGNGLKVETKNEPFKEPVVKTQEPKHMSADDAVVKQMHDDVELYNARKALGLANQFVMRLRYRNTLNNDAWRTVAKLYGVHPDRVALILKMYGDARYKAILDLIAGQWNSIKAPFGRVRNKFIDLGLALGSMGE